VAAAETPMVGSSLNGYGDFRVPPMGTSFHVPLDGGSHIPPDRVCESASPIARFGFQIVV
jgi:hypothetical protein